jgi:hypothetical protein
MLGPGLLLVVFIGLMFHWTVPAENYDSFFEVVWRLLAVMLWFILLWITLPGLPQMRSLRILPVSAAQLAVLITFAPLAAMLAFMVVGGLVLGLIFGMPQRFVLSLFHSGCPLLIAFTTLLIPFFLWLSCFNSALYQALYISLMMFGGLSGLLFQEHLSLPVNLACSLLVICVSFVLTKLLLERSSRVYRPRAGRSDGRS